LLITLELKAFLKPNAMTQPCKCQRDCSYKTSNLKNKLTFLEKEDNGKFYTVEITTSTSVTRTQEHLVTKNVATYSYTHKL
jgi:hypothetical protein